MKTLKMKQLIIGLTIASGLTLTPMVSAIAAQTKTTDAVVTASGKTAESEALATRMSNAGFQAMRAISGARIAIFNDKPELAKTLVASAGEYLKIVAKDDAKYIKSTGLATSGSAVLKLVPIDGSLFVADSFVSSPEKSKKLAKANKQLKSGASKKAIETLKLASIDVRIRRILIPVGLTIEDVKAASNFLENDKFYEANLALKAATDRLVVDTIELFQPE